jgi:thiamine biosynthesis protein ThiC
MINVSLAWLKGLMKKTYVQVMIEGPGHVPLNEVASKMCDWQNP